MGTFDGANPDIRYSLAKGGVDEEDIAVPTKVEEPEGEVSWKVAGNKGIAKYGNQRYIGSAFHLKEGVFPPYKESKSDAHERAERWTRKEDTKPGDRKLASFHKRWYIIEAFSDAKYGYQIIEKVPAKDYDKEARQIGTLTDYESIQEASNQNAEMYIKGRTISRGGHGAGTSMPEYGGENTPVHGMDTAQDRGRNAKNNSTRNNEGSGSDIGWQHGSPVTNTDDSNKLPVDISSWVALVDVLEGLAWRDEEKRLLNTYRTYIKNAQADQERLVKTRKEIARLRKEGDPNKRIPKL